MTSSSPTIRFATEADVPEILALIRELAAYEKESSSVLATESSLLATLSFDPPSSSSSSSSSTPSPGYARTLLIFPPPPPPSSSSTSPTTTTTTTTTRAAGMALYYTSYSTWLACPGIFLEDLYVRPEFRERGFGKLLIHRLAKEAVRISSSSCVGGSSYRGGRLEWNVLKWNEPSLRFYENVGAERLDEWVGMRVDGDRLVKLAGQGDGGGGGGIDI